EVRKGRGLRSATQCPVEIVDPAMERADEGVSAMAALVRHHPAAAVPAHVVKGAHDAIPAAQDQRPLAGDVEGEVVATLGNVGDVPGNLPVAAEHMLELKLEQGLAVIAPG